MNQNQDLLIVVAEINGKQEMPTNQAVPRYIKYFDVTLTLAAAEMARAINAICQNPEGNRQYRAYRRRSPDDLTTIIMDPRFVAVERGNPDVYHKIESVRILDIVDGYTITISISFPWEKTPDDVEDEEEDNDDTDDDEMSEAEIEHERNEMETDDDED